MVHLALDLFFFSLGRYDGLILNRQPRNFFSALVGKTHALLWQCRQHQQRASPLARTAGLCGHGSNSASSSRAKFYTYSASGNGASRLGFRARAPLCAKQQRGCRLHPVCRVTFIPGPARRGGMRSSVPPRSARLGFAFLKPAPSPAGPGWLVSARTFKGTRVGCSGLDRGN